jgi:hypothetical protein
MLLLAKVWGWKGSNEKLEELEKQLNVIIGLEDKGGTDICKSCRKTIEPYAEAEHQLNGPIRSDHCFVTQSFEDGSLGFVIGFSQKHSIKIMTKVDLNNPEDFRAYRRRKPQRFVFKAWLYHGEPKAGKKLADAESRPVLALEKNFSYKRPLSDPLLCAFQHPALPKYGWGEHIADI